MHICRSQRKTLTATPTVYPQTVDVIKALAASRVAMAVASGTPALAVAMHFMEKLSIIEYFSYLEKSGIPYESMLFFDDEAKNICSARKLGVNGLIVGEGLDLKALEEALGLLA